MMWPHPSKINLYLAPEQNQKHTIQHQLCDKQPAGISFII